MNDLPVDDADHWSPPPRRKSVTIAILLIALAAISAILAAWRIWPFEAVGPHTDNAYVEGRTTVIAPQVGGYVSHVAVDDYAQVRQGQLLIRIDDRNYRARVSEAQAQIDLREAELANNVQAQHSARAALDGKIAALDSADAQLIHAEAEFRRQDALVSDGSVSRRERDQALATLRQAQANVRQGKASVAIAQQDATSVDVQRHGLIAQVAAARAQLLSARIDLDHTRIVAPASGQLGEVRARLGQLVTSGSQLMALVPPARWVIANFKEAQTRNIRLGQPVTISVDALGNQRVSGSVERIAPATGAEFSVIKPDNATGNFVKVPQRIGVRIAIHGDPAMIRRILPGMSVETWIDTSGG